MAAKSKGTASPAPEYRFKDWRQSLSTDGAALRFWLCVGVCLLSVLFVKGVINQKDDKDAYNNQAAVAEMFDVAGSPKAQAAQRRELARSILVIKSYGDKIEQFKNPAIQKQLQATAQTGEPINLHPVKPNFSHKLLRIAWILLYVMGCLASLLFGVIHCATSIEQGVLIVRMPWNKPWTWLLPLGAPWLVPFLLLSLCRLLWICREQVKALIREKLKKKPKPDETAKEAVK